MWSRGAASTRTHTNTAVMHVFVLTQQASQHRADWPDWHLVTGGVHWRGGVSGGTRVHSIRLSLRPGRKRTRVGQTLFGSDGHVGACTYHHCKGNKTLARFKKENYQSSAQSKHDGSCARKTIMAEYHERSRKHFKLNA